MCEACVVGAESGLPESSGHSQRLHEYSTPQDAAHALALLESEMVGSGSRCEQIGRLRFLLEKECEAQVTGYSECFLVSFCLSMTIPWKPSTLCTPFSGCLMGGCGVQAKEGLTAGLTPERTGPGERQRWQSPRRVSPLAMWADPMRKAASMETEGLLVSGSLLLLENYNPGNNLQVFDTAWAVS